MKTHLKTKTRRFSEVVFNLCLGLVVISCMVMAENTAITKANYKGPARYGPEKVKKLVFSTRVDAHWLKYSHRLWYEYETTEGKKWIIVDPANKLKKEIFNNVKMAAMLSKMTKDPYDAKHLSIKEIKFINKEKAIYFRVKKNKHILDAQARKEKLEKKQKDKKKEEQEKKEKDSKKKKEDKSEMEKAKEEARKFHHFEYELASARLTLLKDYSPKLKPPKWANISPDGKIVIYGKHFNLFTMSFEDYQKCLVDPKDKSIKEHQLTKDGVEYYSYHRGGRGETNVTKEKNKDKRKAAYVLWSHDSNMLAIVRADSRKVKNLWVINSIANPRPTLETYKYQLPGEAEASQYELLIFDLKKNNKIKVKTDRFKDQSLNIMSAKNLQNTRDDDYRPRKWLSQTADKLYFSRASRDLKRIDICFADSISGEVTVLIEERLNTYVETRRLGFINNGKELIHWSERDGWAHFYLYNGNGKLKKQITSGPWHCNNIVGIDKGNRVLYFTANGMKKDEDPYYNHLYRVNLDGSGLKLLDKRGNCIIN